MQEAFTHADQRLMQRALDLAWQGRYSTRPNPMVGCVLVRNGCIVGEGWHQFAGGPHAEVYALREAGDRARGATAYVTLEPCSHHGRTPPCCDALIAAGVGKVIVACADPSSQINGKGIQRLRAAGIPVEVGLLRAQAFELNRGFLSSVRRGRPWLRLKYGMSLDGRTALADGRSKWITSELAREDVQEWRQRSGAILTGSGTVLADDPALTVRREYQRPVPQRVVIDRQLKVPVQARIFDRSALTLLIHATDAEPAVAYPDHVERLALDDLYSDQGLERVVRVLSARDLHDVWVEAGPVLGAALLNAGLVDELIVYIAPKLLGDTARPLLVGEVPGGLDRPALGRLMDIVQLGDDLRLRYRLSSE